MCVPQLLPEKGSSRRQFCPAEWGGGAVRSSQIIQGKPSPISGQKRHYECGTPLPSRSGNLQRFQNLLCLWIMVSTLGSIKSKKDFFFSCSSAVPIVDIEILSHVSPSGILKAGGSLLKVTSYKIFSMLFASGCQIRLIRNTIN